MQTDDPDNIEAASALRLPIDLNEATSRLLATGLFAVETMEA